MALPCAMHLDLIFRSMMDMQRGEEWKHENRLLLAIEQLALAPRYLFGSLAPPATGTPSPPKGHSTKEREETRAEKNGPAKGILLNAQQFVEFLSYLQMGPKDLLSSEKEPKENYKNYANYRELLTKRYGIYLDFQKKVTSGYQNYPDRQLRILFDYLRIFRIPAAPGLVERLHKHSLGKYNLLERLASIRYYIKFSMPLRFTYQKLFGKEGEQSRRIVLPLAIVGLGNYLSLIAVDTKDRFIRSFILSCMQELKSDLYYDFMQRQLYAESEGKGGSDFDLPRFLREDESARFYRERVEYVIRLSEPSLHHFEHSYNYDFELLDDPLAELSGRKTIRFTSSDPYEVRRMLFDYGPFAEILEPKDFRMDFLESLRGLIEFYER